MGHNRLAGEAGHPAILGGIPVHEKEWPAWPRAGMLAQRMLLDVLHSQTWTITARTRKTNSYEKRFGESFAQHVKRRFAVPCSSGTSALTIALQAMEIGPGDEVIVPGMTWVACASAVAHLGAVPVLVDIGPQSLCMAPAAVEEAISPATKAVLGVHMYSSRADLRQLTDICRRRGLTLIEDASQAHGACLADGPVGSFGAISVFSFQQTKLLTAGEGGIAVTDDQNIYERLQKFRADGRIYNEQPLEGGFYDLADIGGVLGRNLCLSEFHAAILIEGLQRLDRENLHRAAMAAELERGLVDLGGVELVRDQLSPRGGATFYKIPLRLDDEAFRAIGAERLARALSAELNLAVEPLDPPLNRHPLYQPLTAPLVTRIPGSSERVDPRRYPLPAALDAWHNCVALPHSGLLGGLPEVEAVVTALNKIRRHAKVLSALPPGRRP